MRKQVLFVQGAGEGAHDAWDEKLVLSLKRRLGDGYEVVYPRMPNESDPRYPTWKAAVLTAVESVEDGAVVVGHSIGGAILIHAVAEQPPKRRLRAVLLIAAPFIGAGGWPSDEIEPRADFSQRLPADVPVFLYHGDGDATVPFAHLSLYAKAIPFAEIRALAHRDHQLNNELAEVARDILKLPEVSEKRG